MEYCIQVALDLTVPEPLDPESFRFQRFRPILIVSRLPFMVAAVDFDHESTLHTDEVDEERSDRCLSAKLVARQLAVAKHIPESAFSVR